MVKKVNVSESAAIELYVMSVEVDDGIYVIGTMLSESHNASTIQFFLMKCI